ncbi:hypothetical protein QE152_g23610 [Popillia japonica]|uniref:Retroviral polymerase SH3-like domain-containing protein n=1 Tax=Popillia japonica TaxID=7064 RepID=A0AAW1KH87_POPJA
MGCRAFSHILKNNRKKWDDKTNELIFVGYSTSSKGYRLLNPTNNCIIESRNIHFIETEMFMSNFKEIPQNIPLDNDWLFLETNVEPATVHEVPENPTIAALQVDTQIEERPRRTCGPPAYLQDYDTTDIVDIHWGDRVK